MTGTPTAGRKPARKRPRRPSEPTDRLGPRQHKAIEHELSGKTFAEIARLVGVSRQHVYKWHDASKHPAFVAELDRQRRERAGAIGETVRSQQTTLVDGHRRVLEVLLTLAEDLAQEPRDRIRAASEYARSAVIALELSGFQPPTPPPEEAKPADDTGFGRILADIKKLAAEDIKALEPPK